MTSVYNIYTERGREKEKPLEKKNAVLPHTEIMKPTKGKVALSCFHKRL